MTDLRLAAAQGEDVADLLGHIAWQEVIKPRLNQAKLDLASQLAVAALGIPRAANAPTKEQLAAQIYGIEFITKLFERILQQGERAIATLNSTSWAIVPTSNDETY